jgi:uncharacterized membrane protein
MHLEKERQNIVGFYILFAVGFVMDFIPFQSIEMMGLCIAIVTVFAAYIYRWRSPLSSLTYNHMSFLIATFWASSLLLLIGLIIATIWVYRAGDHTAIMNLIDAMNKGAVFTPYDMQQILHGYMGANMKVLVTSALTTLFPGFVYLAYRVWAGMRHALRGDNMPFPSAWFRVT